MKKTQMIKYINTQINIFKKMGIDIKKITEGKTVEQLAFNKTTYNNFKKRVKRQRELPKIKEQNKVNDYKRQQEIQYLNDKRRKQNRNYYSKKTQNFIKFNTKLPVSQETAKILVKKESDKMLNRYFKPVKDHAKVKTRIDLIQRRLGNRLDKYYQLIDDFAKYEYKYPYEKDLMKTEMTDEYEKNIIDRLNDIEDLLDEYDL